MKTRRYTQADYSKLVTLWKQYPEWAESPVPELILPPYGLVVEQDNKLLAGGFLYQTKGNGCTWMEWIVADATADKHTRDNALNLLIDTMLKDAKDEGYQFVFMSVKHPKLIERLQTKGFQKGDPGMINMIRRL